MLQSGGHNHKWLTIGVGGYVTLATWGAPNALQRGAKWPTSGPQGLALKVVAARCRGAQAHQNYK